MSRRRAYRRTDVKKIELEQLRDVAAERGAAGTTVGLDIGKDEIVVCVRWGTGDFERPWKVANTCQIDLLTERLRVLKEVCDSLTVGMESTGTYGDAVRRALTVAGLEVHRVSGKATSDYREIFDGVPSQHDGKDAAMVAELTAYGKGKPWPYSTDSQTLQEVKYWVRRMDCDQTASVQWIGRLESLVARHWPELTRLLKLNSVSLLRLLAHYQSASRLVADAEAKTLLRQWGGAKLTDTKIARVIESARTTCGMPPTEWDADWIGHVAKEALRLRCQKQTCVKELSRLMNHDESMARYTSAVGASTLAVIWASVGDPRDYHSSGAFLKALGLNLKELSSGRRVGELAISKRGPSQARRWIFYWALRAIQRKELSTWYAEFIKVGQSRSGKQEHRKMKALIAMMRKLCRGLWHAMKHDEEFNYGQLLEPKRRRKRRRTRRRRGATCGV